MGLALKIGRDAALVAGMLIGAAATATPSYRMVFVEQAGFPVRVHFECYLDAGGNCGGPGGVRWGEVADANPHRSVLGFDTVDASSSSLTALLKVEPDCDNGPGVAEAGWNFVDPVAGALLHTLIVRQTGHPLCDAGTYLAEVEFHSALGGRPLTPVPGQSLDEGHLSYSALSGENQVPFLSAIEWMDVSFKVVPEPGAPALFALSLGALAWRMWQRPAR